MLQHFFAATSQLSDSSSNQTSNIILYLVGAVAVIGLIALVVYTLVAMGKLYEKAGEHGWAIFVPFYSIWVFLRMGKFPGALSLLAFIPVVGTLIVGVLQIIAAYRIGLRLGKSGAFVLLYIFLSLIWFIILGYDKSQWSDDETESFFTDPGQMGTPQAPLPPQNPPTFTNGMN